MPSVATRPGIDSEFLIEDMVQGKPVKLHCRYYQLFCRWHKRTYGVLAWRRRTSVSTNESCSARRARRSRSRCSEYQDMKEQEKRDLINKEGRDPTKAILDAHKTGDDKDKKEPPKDPEGRSQGSEEDGTAEMIGGGCRRKANTRGVSANARSLSSVEYRPRDNKELDSRN